MAEEYYRGFDYYIAEPPCESAVPPPCESAFPAPEDEFNEKIVVSDNSKRKKTSLGLMLAAGGLAVSFIIPGASSTQTETEVTSESTVIETSVSEVSGPAPDAADGLLTTETQGSGMNAGIYE